MPEIWQSGSCWLKIRSMSQLSSWYIQVRLDPAGQTVRGSIENDPKTRRTQGGWAWRTEVNGSKRFELLMDLETPLTHSAYYGSASVWPVCLNRRICVNHRMPFACQNAWI
jgi:hypothetical protein